jgi:hypothetical protein
VSFIPQSSFVFRKLSNSRDTASFRKERLRNTNYEKGMVAVRLRITNDVTSDFTESFTFAPATLVHLYLVRLKPIPNNRLYDAYS